MDTWLALDWSRPAWLAALAALPPCVYWFLRGTMPGGPKQRCASLLVRSMVIGLVVLALADPRRSERTTQRTTVVFALDRSVSVGPAARRRAEKFIERAAARAGDHCGTVVLPFASRPGNPITNLSAKVSPLDRTATNIEAVIAAAASSAGGATHVVLLSDGNETHGDALAAAQALRLPISTVPLAASEEPEMLVCSLVAPAEARQGEPFRLKAVVETNQAREAAVELRRDGRTIASRPCQLVPGENQVIFEQSLAGPSAACFEVCLGNAGGDTIAGNNRALASVAVAAKPRVLVLARESEAMRPFVQALTAEEIDVEERLPDGLPPSLSELRAYDLLVLANVPVEALPDSGPSLVRDYVAEVGGGLLVLGGDASFGLGGFDSTPLGDVLPLASDFRRVRETDNLALLLVIDHSGSMKGLKIEMAKDAAMRAVEAVRGDDLVGVMSFDGIVEWVSPGLATAGDKVRVAAGIAAIEPRGGTEMFEALRQAYLALADAPARRKQVIVLTDGKSKPGAFEQLASQFAAAGISISTVAVGDEADQPLLRRVANLGGGRYYFTDDPRHLPRIFSAETTLVTGMALDESASIAHAIWQAPPLSGVDLTSAGPLLGHVLTRQKPASDLVLATERGEPLLAWWRYGLGLSVAFTSDATGRWGAQWIRWPDYGKLWSQIVRHALGARPTFDVRIERRQTRATVTIDTIRSDDDCSGDNTGITAAVTDPRGRRRAIELTTVAPDRLIGQFAARQTGVYRIDIAQMQPRKTVHRQTASLSIDYPDELGCRPTNTDLLRRLAEATGGQYDPRPEDVCTWHAPTGRRSVPLWPLFVKSALLLFAIDVALRRLPLSFEVIGGFTVCRKTASTSSFAPRKNALSRSERRRNATRQGPRRTIA